MIQHTASPAPIRSVSTASRRTAWLCCMLAAMALGYASRRLPWLFPAMLGKYPGDALWATMVFFGWRAIFPLKRLRAVAAIAATSALVIELLKLYQAPWLVAIRKSTLGHLVFGHVFSFENLIAYAAGIALGAGIAWMMQARAGATVPAGRPANDFR